MKFWLMAILALLLVVFAACGGDDDDGSGDSSDETAASATDDGDETAEATDEPDVEETDEPQETVAPDNGGGDLAINPCELVTSEEAAEAIGGATEEPVLDPNIGENFSQCLWRIEGGTELDEALIVQVRADSSSEDYAETLDENCPEALGEPVHVSGVGDAANECIALIVLSGEVIFAVTVLSGTGDIEAELAKQEELAQTIIGRLP